MTEMNHNQIANSACDAFDIIANSVINRATFDKTIIGVIVSCADAELGQYKVLYQDAHYYATVSNTEDSYNTGDNVYILIPENDLTKPKKILGTVENLGDDYLAQTNINSQFDTIGENAITVENNYINDFSYCSYKGEEYEVLYDVNNIENNKININTIAFAGSARSAEKLQITAKIKTLIPAEQLNGNFGLKVDIETYVDLETKDTVVKTYILDINSMVGTIYNLSNYLTQSTLLDFNGSMFKRITKITAFIKDFQKDNNKINIDDIYISDIGIFAMISADEKSWNTYYLTLETPNGVSLSKSLTSLILNARVVYKNREVLNSKLNYYWFLKDMSISKTSDKYCVHGGQGWYCLNEYKDGKWIPANFNYSINNTKMLGNSAEYKCVAVLDDIAIAYNQKTIYNEDAEYIVDMDVLDLPSKTFYANQGTASLICNVQDNTQKEISNIDDFIFHWGRLDSQDNYLDFDVENGSSEQIINDMISPLTNAELLKKTKILFTHMETILSQNTELRKDYFFSTSRFEDEDKELTYFNIKNILETVFNMEYGGIITKKYKNEQVLTKIQEFIDSQKVLSCVVKNIFHNLKASIINERNTFTCTVYKIDQDTGEELYIGTDSLIISNLISPANATYKINLINKNQVFKYNESGKSPTHHTYESPQEILPLSFELFDNNNTKIDLSQSQSAVIRWYIPIEDTLLILPEDIDEEKKSIDETNTYYIINDSTLSFEIVDTYDMNKRNNNILLEVIYNTFNEKISTNFSFFKEGFMGTNGSDYFCRIVPNHITNNYPTLYCYNNENNEFKVESNFTGGEENINNGEIPWFSVELWDGGEQLDLSMANIEWKILTNGKETPLEILDKSNQNIFIQLNENIFKEILNENISPCLTIQASVSYAGKKYFATQPLAISYSQGTELKYKLNIKAKTGFNEAIYSNDGVNPQFNSATPFEAEVLLVDSINITDDNNTVTITDLNITAIETENDEYQTPLAFDWAVFKDSMLKTKKALNALDYQIKCQPPDIYDGLNVSNGIVLKIGKRNISGELETEYQRLYFPIHLYLNRYGHSHLNEWDGNSIQISEEEGYILSPQIGAGKKNDDNTFTGMLMGEVKGGLKNKTGLLGYGHGIQTMFLDAETGSAYFGKSGEIAIEPKGENTEVKLGVWNLDNEAIWRGNNQLGGSYQTWLENNPKPDDNASSSIKEQWEKDSIEAINLGKKDAYLGDKGFSLGDKLSYDNETGELKVKGEINATSGVFKGIIQAQTGGRIANWNIEENRLWYTDTSNGKTYQLGKNGFSLVSNGKSLFEAGSDGVYIDGEIKAEAGNIGDFAISSNGLVFRKVINDTYGNPNAWYQVDIGDMFTYEDDEELSVPGIQFSGSSSSYEDCIYKLALSGEAESMKISTSNTDMNRYEEIEVHHRGISWWQYPKNADPNSGNYNQYAGGGISFWHEPGFHFLELSYEVNYNDGTPRSGTTIEIGGLDSSYLRSNTDDYTYLGTKENRWISVYAKDGSINTSDRNEKENIQPLSDKYIQLFKNLKPVSYNFIGREKTRTGFIAQDIEESLEKLGLNNNEFGALCKEEDDNEKGKFYYGLHYEDFNALTVAVLQKALKKIDELEERIKELEK